MNTRLIISLLCAGALAFACGPRSHSDAPKTLVSVLPGASPVGQASSGPVHRRDKSAARIVRIASKLNVAVGHRDGQRDVRLALDVTNTGGKHAELDFPTGQAYEFVVVDSVGREVWRWSNRHVFTQGLQNKELGSGDSMEVSETWTQNAKPGRYTAIATLKSSNFPVEQRAEFVLQ